MIPCSLALLCSAQFSLAQFYSAARAPAVSVVSLSSALLAFIFATQLEGANLLSEGNQAFQAGDFAKAVELYESEEEGVDDSSAERLTRRFNAGVSLERAGDLDGALTRFEDVSVRARGTLRAAALYNSGGTHFARGRAIARTSFEKEEFEERVAGLTEAARAYHSALEFFRRVEREDNDGEFQEDAAHNISVTKTALRAVLDEIARMEEEKARQEEDEALKSPEKLLASLQRKEKLHRAASRALAASPGQRVRLACRRLRKSETKNRDLAERLLHVLKTEAPPAASPPGTPPPPTPEPDPEEAARKAHAAAAVAQAIEAMKDAEVAHGKLSVESAVGAHTRAVTHLRTAREAFPVDLPALLEEGIQTQEMVLRGTRQLHGSPAEPEGEPGTGGTAAGKSSGGLAGLGGALVDALEDKILQPLAKLLQPERKDRIQALADEETDVVWVAGLLTQAQLPPPPPEAAAQPSPGGLPPHAGHGGAPGQQPQLSAEEVEAINQALALEGETARAASERAQTALEATDLEAAEGAAEEALAALERLRDLLPKPPEPPEVRLRKLIEKQRSARGVSGALGDLEGDARRAASEELGEAQRVDGKEAASIAEELETRPDEPAKKAVAKIRQGEDEIYASAEASRRGFDTEASAAIDRDIEHLEEALALLSGEQDQEDEGQQNQDQEQNQDSQGEEPRDEQQQAEQRAYALSPEEARRQQEDMDKKRREEEAKIFAGSSSVTVDKDW